MSKLENREHVLSELRNYRPAELSDSLGRTRATGGFLALWDDSRLGPMCGFAKTIEVPPGENLAIHKYLPKIEWGDVLVVAVGGDVTHAVSGELVARALRERGATGLIVDGAVRDGSALRVLDWPVLTRGFSPLGPAKTPVGTLGKPVEINGLVVSESDLIVADTDGIVAIAAHSVAETLQSVLEVRERERRWAQANIGQ